MSNLLCNVVIELQRREFEKEKQASFLCLNIAHFSLVFCTTQMWKKNAKLAQCELIPPALCIEMLFLLSHMYNQDVRESLCEQEMHLGSRQETFPVCNVMEFRLCNFKGNLKLQFRSKQLILSLT